MDNWMTNLPRNLRTIPIIYLAIPGSHDSATSTITSKSTIAPDAEQIIRRLTFLGPILTKIMVKWSRTQTLKIIEQLHAGIRYFDFRIATKPPNSFHFVHGLYSVEISGVLRKIRHFLDSHPKEIVILDCQHFYGFHKNQANHSIIYNYFMQIFGEKMLPNTIDLKEVSLEYMTTKFKYQVIVIYRVKLEPYRPVCYWPSEHDRDTFLSPWPNTYSKTKLLETLDNGLSTRQDGKAYISQCVLTPTTWYVVSHLWGSLKSRLVIPFEQRKLEWLIKQTPGPKGLNIIITDFIELGDHQYVKEVVRLNEKLLGNDSLLTIFNSTTTTTMSTMEISTIQHGFIGISNNLGDKSVSNVDI